MNVRRVASVGSALAVGGIAAYASYSHMRHLAIEYGQDRTVATLLPVSVDGLMVVATIALGDGRQNRWSAWLAFWAGVAASVIANVLAAQPSGIARTISAWPAIAFLLVVEVITRGGRIRAAVEAAASLHSVEGGISQGRPTKGVTEGDTPLDGEGAHVVRAPAESADTQERATRRPGRRQTAADRVARAAARTPAATPAQLAARLKLSERTVQRYLPRPADDITTPPQRPSEQVNGRTPALVTADQGGTR